MAQQHFWSTVTRASCHQKLRSLLHAWPGRLMKCTCCLLFLSSGFSHPTIKPALHVFRCKSQSSCSPSAYAMLPQEITSASGLKARDWVCAEENGLQVAFDADLQHLPFCIEGLCKSALPCSPDLKVESKKLWRCPKGETQVFRRDPNASNSFFCGVGDRGSSAEAADHQKLVLGVLAGTVVALCVGIMMWLVRSHPARVKKSALKLDWPESQVEFHCYSFFCAGSLSPSCAWSVE